MKSATYTPESKRIPGNSPPRWAPGKPLLNAILCMFLLASGWPDSVSGFGEDRPLKDRWLSQDGTPLPFETEEEVLDFLKKAEILELETIPEGINGAQRVLLGQGGLRARAVFRTVEVYSRRGEFGYRGRTLIDGSIYECAAYELSKLIHFNRIPPVVPREIEGTNGTLQLWLEGAEMEKALLEGDRPRPDMAGWDLQKQMMMVFDDLVFNTDRHLGNVMVGHGSDLWLIDHTRTFRPYTYLQFAKKVTRCERTIWERLKGLSEDTIKRALQPYLKKSQIKAVERRRQKLVDHFKKLIGERGEEAVIFDWPTR